MGLDRAERDRQLSPSLSAKAAMEVLARHAARTAALWSDPLLECQRGIAYAAAPRAQLDLVRPAGPGPFPCLAFLHGGFWQEGDKGGSGFAAKVFADAGWASALIGYTLAPEARLSDIVAEAGRAMAYLLDNASDLRLLPGRIIVAGHSAGAHLAAALICGKAGERAAQSIAGAVLISGVYDLEPIAASYVNDAVRMDADEMRALSILGDRPGRGVPVILLIGADEPAAFQEQTDALFQAWGESGLKVAVLRVEGRDHFDILDELADPASSCFAAVMETSR